MKGARFNPSLRFTAFILTVFSLLSFSACGLPGCFGKNGMGGGDYQYREDELSLIKLTVEDILNLEKQQRYFQVYREFTSKPYKTRHSRRQFLAWSRCVESTLGPILETHQDTWNIRRDNSKPSMPLDIVTLTILREKGLMTEKLVFAKYGLDYKLERMTWHASDTLFMDCLKSIKLPATDSSTEMTETQAIEVESRDYSDTPSGSGSATSSPSRSSRSASSSDSSDTPVSSSTSSTRSSDSSDSDSSSSRSSSSSSDSAPAREPSRQEPPKPEPAAKPKPSETPPTPAVKPRTSPVPPTPAPGHDVPAMKPRVEAPQIRPHQAPLAPQEPEAPPPAGDEGAQ